VTTRAAALSTRWSLSVVAFGDSARERDSQANTLVAYLTIVTFKMWAYSPKITEIVNFWYKFAQKGYTP